MREPVLNIAAWLGGILGLGALAVLVVSAVWSPEAMAGGEPLLLLGVTPEPCPGCPLCGMSRAFAAMTRWDVGAAVGFNPGVLLLYPLLGLVAVAGPALSLRRILRRRKPCTSPRPS
ncbi:MAG: DUF2752 domain-containing protein [Proteobacteria bacterium]|nr:DUF2752 domain-containing protein [Pseudomonadota bacterium]